MYKAGTSRKSRGRSRRHVHHTYDYEKDGLRPEEAKIRAAQDRLEENTEISLVAKAVSWNDGGDRWLTDATVQELENAAKDSRRVTPKVMVMLFAMNTLAKAISAKKDPKTGKPIDPSPEQLDRAERVARIVAMCEAQNQRDDLANDDPPVPPGLDQSFYGDNVANARRLIAAAKVSEVPAELPIDRTTEAESTE